MPPGNFERLRRPRLNLRAFLVILVHFNYLPNLKTEAVADSGIWKGFAWCSNWCTPIIKDTCLAANYWLKTKLFTFSYQSSKLIKNGCVTIQSMFLTTIVIATVHEWWMYIAKYSLSLLKGGFHWSQWNPLDQPLRCSYWRTLEHILLIHLKNRWDKIEGIWLNFHWALATSSDISSPVKETSMSNNDTKLHRSTRVNYPPSQSLTLTGNKHKFNT